MTTKAAMREMEKHPIGQTSTVQMGQILPHAIKVESYRTHFLEVGTYKDDLNQLVVSGTVVEKPGHSKYRMGDEIGFVIYWQ